MGLEWSGADLKVEHILTRSEWALPLPAKPLAENGQISRFTAERPSVLAQLAAAKPAEKTTPAQAVPKKSRVPEDIRLVALTDEEGEDNPNDITMRVDSVEMGRLAMERLLRKIGQPERKPHHIIVPMRFSMKQDKEKR